MEDLSSPVDGVTDTTRFRAEIEAAREAIRREEGTPRQRVEMLVEIAVGLQLKPKHPEQLEGAVELYREALRLCPEDQPLLLARTLARLATALHSLPTGDLAPLREAAQALEQARSILETRGTPEETAELDMNLGLVLQSLSAHGAVSIGEAIRAHQRALEVFRASTHPQEFAIVQNNLATAFLAVPLTDERIEVREALAVDCFERALAAVTLIDHPNEYAMLQNNLGNALQYASSTSPQALENNLRALEAYEEALKVRTPDASPAAYANTIANKANCLANLPDDVNQADLGNRHNLQLARELWLEAKQIFENCGECDKVEAVAAALSEIDAMDQSAADLGRVRVDR